VGPFRLEEALLLDEMEKTADPAHLHRYLIPLALCLPGLKTVRLDGFQARRLAQGQTLPWPEQDPAEGEKVRVVADGNLVAVATVRWQGTAQVLAPVRIFNNSC
jgi:tRNA U55 pseudouridine synthase TruB